jgi:hypothetical protein
VVNLTGLTTNNAQGRGLAVTSAGVVVKKDESEGATNPTWTQTPSWGQAGPSATNLLYTRSGSYCQCSAAFTGVVIPITNPFAATFTLPIVRTGNFAGDPSELTGVLVASRSNALAVGTVTPLAGTQLAQVTVQLISSIAVATSVDLYVSFTYGGLSPSS